MSRERKSLREKFVKTWKLGFCYFTFQLLLSVKFCYFMFTILFSSALSQIFRLDLQFIVIAFSKVTCVYNRHYKRYIWCNKVLGKKLQKTKYGQSFNHPSPRNLFSLYFFTFLLYVSDPLFSSLGHTPTFK